MQFVVFAMKKRYLLNLQISVKSVISGFAKNAHHIAGNFLTGIFVKIVKIKEEVDNYRGEIQDKIEDNVIAILREHGVVGNLPSDEVYKLGIEASVDEEEGVEVPNILILSSESEELICKIADDSKRYEVLEEIKEKCRPFLNILNDIGLES